MGTQRNCSNAVPARPAWSLIGLRTDLSVATASAEVCSNVGRDI